MQLISAIPEPCVPLSIPPHLRPHVLSFASTASPSHQNGFVLLAKKRET
jgi:hypothetical protein